MPKYVLTQGHLSPNRNGANLYFGPRLLGQPAMALDQGQDVVAELVPHRGVMLFPAGATVRFPVEVPHPAAIHHDPGFDRVDLTVSGVADGV